MHILVCHNSKDMITYHKKKNKRYWKSNLLRVCSNKEQIDQIPLLLDVKDLLTQVKVLDKKCTNLPYQLLHHLPANLRRFITDYADQG